MKFNFSRSFFTSTNRMGQKNFMNPGQKRVKWYESIILISRKNFDSFWEDIFRKLFHMFFLPDFGPSIDSKCNFFSHQASYQRRQDLLSF